MKTQRGTAIRSSCEGEANDCSPDKRIKKEEEEPIELIKSSLTQKIPKEILREIFSHLSIYDRWKMRLNKILKEVEEMDSPFVPYLKITSQRTARSDGVTLRAPSDDITHNQANVFIPQATDFIRRLERLADYNIGVIHLQGFVCQSCPSFRQKVFSSIGKMKADTVICEGTYLTHFDLPEVVKNKKKFAINHEFRSMFSTGYAKVAKMMHNREIELRSFVTPIHNPWIFHHLEDDLSDDAELGPLANVNFPHYTGNNMTVQSVPFLSISCCLFNFDHRIHSGD
ncbi:hypothetical protein PENTCL1PPCAC_22248 [Pristionchus entomophagus]|uniref:F-box domain-containing protein n=1 Tax=Pristionchus entomophagus TaxID=358040 RepID=A0AAV5U0W2_9BILA|nr:hypothetical protein PENTCL1PPCAC_22248 [Pristionchus entomophagus]